ncbi:hypothetical protein Q6247_25480, partial [Klebsiella pneumoniae]
LEKMNKITACGHVVPTGDVPTYSHHDTHSAAGLSAVIKLYSGLALQAPDTTDMSNPVPGCGLV